MGERSCGGQGATFAGRERMELAMRGEGEYGKSTPPQKQLERKWKIGNSHKDQTKKGERRTERV